MAETSLRRGLIWQNLALQSSPGAGQTSTINPGTLYILQAKRGKQERNSPVNKSLANYLNQARDRQLQELLEWLRIPSISALPEHKADVRRAGEWAAAALGRAGLEHVQLIESDIHPLVYGDWLHAGAEQPTVLIYGHFDVQPVDPLDLWTTPPFEPTVRGENLYARGAADDKGQTFIHVKAVEALLQTVGKLPVNVKFILEGEEEFGGATINRYVPTHAEQLAAEVVLISDTHMLSPTQPSILYGLRGMWAGELTVRGAAHDLHSGSYGGAIHNANQALAELLAALHGPDGRVTVPGFYDQVRPLAAAERVALARVPYGEQEILSDSGAPAVWGEAEYNVTRAHRGATDAGDQRDVGRVHRRRLQDRDPRRSPGQTQLPAGPDQDPAQIGAALAALSAATCAAHGDG